MSTDRPTDRPPRRVTDEPTDRPTDTSTEGPTARLIVVAGKGGDGKSSTTVNLGAELAARGLRVLLVDLDPQGTVSGWIGPLDPEATIEEYLAGEAELDDVAHVVAVEGRELDGEELLVHVAPCGTELGDVEDAMPLDLVVPTFDGLRAAATALGFDVVVVDTYPTRPLGVSGKLLLGAYAVADLVVLPVRPASVSLQALAHPLRGRADLQRFTGRTVRLALLPNVVPVSRMTTEATNSLAMLDALAATSELTMLPTVRLAAAVGAAQGRRAFLVPPRTSSRADVHDDLARAARAVVRAVGLPTGSRSTPPDPAARHEGRS